MSKFGFNKAITQWERIKKQALTQVAYATRDYFVRSFNKQAWDDAKWKQLKREEPPLKLLVSGKLVKGVSDSIKNITSNKVEFEASARDGRGREYSAYHVDGTDKMPARPFMPQKNVEQPKDLTELQLKILYKETGKIWQVTA